MASEASSIDLSVVFGERSLQRLREIGLEEPWQDMMKFMAFAPRSSRKPSMVIEDIAFQVEAYVEKIYRERFGEYGGAQLQVQVIRVASQAGTEVFEFGDQVKERLRPGDTITMELHTNSLELAMSGPRFSKELIDIVRSRLRFDLNDRVLCNCGDRWLPGHVVGTAVPDDNLLAYLVRTDALPGIPSDTISVPSDNDKLCIQEVCFDPDEQLQLVRCAASFTAESNKPKLRFGVGDKVVCRLRNDAKDGLENWFSGAITEVWPKIEDVATPHAEHTNCSSKGDCSSNCSGKTGDTGCGLGVGSGKLCDVVPYKIGLVSGKWVYCHRDDHTLIRREGLKPLTRVKGVSKRMETVKEADGTKFVVDHATERRKRMLVDSDSDS